MGGGVLTRVFSLGRQALWLVLCGMLGAVPVRSQETGDITVQLRNIDATEALKVLADKGGLNLAISAKVQGRVSLFLEGVSVRQALDVLVESSGLAYVERDGVIQVFAAQEYEERFGRPFRDRSASRIFALKHAQATVLQQALLQLKSPQGKLAVDKASNSVLVVDQPEIIENMAAVVERFDAPLTHRAFALRHGALAEIATAAEKALSEAGRLEIDAPRNRLLVWDIPSKVEALEEVVAAYDQPARTKTRRFLLDYAAAAEVGRLLEAEATEGVGVVRVDTARHSVVVTDLPARLKRMEALVAALDLRPQQVRIEAKIVQVVLKDQYKLGIDWEYMSSKLNGLNIASRLLTLGEGDPATTLRSGVLAEDNYQVLLEALEEVGNTNVYSTPRITAMDGTEAKILVGSTVPYKTIDTRESNGVLTRFEEVTLVDVGVQLTVVPRISRDGFVEMRIAPRVSSVLQFQDGVPVVETSEAETVLLARDGATVVLAGLIEDDTKETRKGIPLLVRLPLLGRLFSSTDVSTDKSELVFFLTPRIVTGEGDFDEVGRFEGKDWKSGEKD